MKLLIQKLTERQNLSRQEAAEAMRYIMEGRASDAQIAAFLVALKLKGEQPEEIAGFVEIMREKSLKITIDDPDAIDMCGTGGDGLGTFNISTVASFVVAGTGVTVAKHGNRSISSACGSADVLKALGVNIEAFPEKVQTCVNKGGIGFFFAPLFHPAMKYAAKPRAELGVRTCFNILGPMTNPAGVKRQLIGTFDGEIARIMSQVFSMFNATKICIVHSDDGLDELSLGGTTTIYEVSSSNPCKNYTLGASSLGLPHIHYSSILGGTAERNASILQRVLGGEKGAYRDTVIANAAAGLYVAGKATTIGEGVYLSSESIDSGKALAKLIKLKELSNA